jgi:hypothetical protein
MAYVSQEMKKERAPEVKAILKQYGLRGTLSVDNHSTLVLTIQKGRFNIGEDHVEINTYWVNDNHKGEMKACLNKLVDALKGKDYFDKSDIMTDYFHCSHYIKIQFGKWNKPYIYDKSIKKGGK